MDEMADRVARLLYERRREVEGQSRR
jgi:hypothetical protein